METDFLNIFPWWRKVTAPLPADHPVKLTLFQSYKEWLKENPNGYID